MQINVRYLRGK